MTERPVGMALDRRSFLVGSVGSIVMMAFGQRTAGAAARDALAGRRFAPTIWFEIDADGAVMVNIAKAEMGQHVGTAHARIVADELGADWSRVSIRHVDSDPRWGIMITGGSWSVFTSFRPLSQAGAAGRLALEEAGAALLGADPADCVAADGRITAGEKAITFGEIVRRGSIDRVFSAEELAAFEPKRPEDRTMIGRPAAAFDVPAKSDGSAVYGIDVELPGMVFARPVLPPTRYGCEVDTVDEQAAKQVPGYLGHLVLHDPSNTLQGWVVALADSQWGALGAGDALQVAWRNGPAVSVSETDLLAEGERLVDDPASGALLVDHGDARAAATLAAAARHAVYRNHTALHFALEPLNAVAEQRDGTWHVHAGTQWQSLTLPLLAKALEVPESRIVLHQSYLGGAFGRRLVGDYCLPAVLAAKALARPVKVLFTREDDSRFDCVRSPAVQRFDASFDATGRLTGIEHAAAAGWPTLNLAPFLLVDGLADTGPIDPFSISGADHWYTLPNHRVRAINNPLAHRTFQPGWLRGVGPGWTGWGVESFIDELAAISGVDPLAFRLAMLDATGVNAGRAPESVGGARRLANVLRVLREQASWGEDMPPDTAQGVAACQGQERTMPTWVGCVARVAVNRETGAVKVGRLSLTIDCGTVVHPDGALAQAESAALWGLSLALHEGTRFENGQVADRNLDRYTPLRMADVPELDIRFIDSTEVPTGLGEPPMLAVAPAIGNALFRAVGARVRDLPIRPDAVLAALRGA